MHSFLILENLMISTFNLLLGVSDSLPLPPQEFKGGKCPFAAHNKLWHRVERFDKRIKTEWTFDEELYRIVQHDINLC